MIDEFGLCRTPGLAFLLRFPLWVLCAGRGQLPCCTLNSALHLFRYVIASCQQRWWHQGWMFLFWSSVEDTTCHSYKNYSHQWNLNTKDNILIKKLLLGQFFNCFWNCVGNRSMIFCHDITIVLWKQSYDSKVIKCSYIFSGDELSQNLYPTLNILFTVKARRLKLF